MRKQSFMTAEEIERLKQDAKATQVWLPIISDGLRSEAPEDSRELVHLAKRNHADWLDALATSLEAIPSLLVEREALLEGIKEVEGALVSLLCASTHPDWDYHLASGDVSTAELLERVRTALANSAPLEEEK